MEGKTPKTHITTPGDKLRSLSEINYGSPELADLIQEVNEKEQNIKLDPDRLPRGLSLRIPGAYEQPREEYWRQQVRLVLRNHKIFHVTSQFLGADEIPASDPVLVPVMPLGAVFGTEIVLSLGGLCQKLEGIPQHVFETDDPNLKWRKDFNFEWKQNPADIQNASDLYAKITIKANNLWRMGRDARTTLRTNFEDFCSEIEKLEFNGIIIPGGTALVTQLVAESLPATLDETLLFRYGFNKGFGPDSTPYVDLLPGMRLRLETSANQYMKSSSSLDGPVGSGQFFYTLGRNREQQITFDAFLDSMSAPDTPFSPNEDVVANLLGLHKPGAARRHYRLFYPSQIMSNLSDNEIATAGITLIGADSLEDLQTATQTFTTSGDIGKAKLKPIIAFTLRGWSLVIPEIEIFITRKVGRRINEFSRYVPLGTTVRQVIDNMIPVWHPNVLLVGGGQPVLVRRLFSLENGIPDYQLIEFRLPSGVDFEPGLFDLPLVMGDHLEISLATP